MSVHGPRMVSLLLLLLMLLCLGLPSFAQEDFDAFLEEIRAAYRFRAENLESLRLTFEGNDIHGVGVVEGAVDPVSVEGLSHNGTLILSSEFGIRLDTDQDILNYDTFEAQPLVFTDIYRQNLQEYWHYEPATGAGTIGPQDTLSNWADVQYLLFSYENSAPFLTGVTGMDRSLTEGPPGIFSLSEEDRADIQSLAAFFDQRESTYLGMIQTEEGLRAVFRTTPPVLEGHEPGPDGMVIVPVGEGNLGVQHTETDYWLDPERDYVMTRMTARTPNGNVVEEARLDYAPNENLGFVPVKLEYTSYGPDGGIIDRLNRTVVAAETNFPVDEALFDKPFPEGTKVKDLVRNREYMVGEKKATVPPAPSPAHADSLPPPGETASPPVPTAPAPTAQGEGPQQPAPKAEGGSPWVWPVLFGTGIVLLCVLAAVWRRTRGN